MAKLNYFPIAIFLCLLAVSGANRPENDEPTGADPSEPTSATTTILLPSEKPGHDAATLVHFNHDDSENRPTSVPLTKVNFRHINRHFRPRGAHGLLLRRVHPYRHGRHRWAPILVPDHRAGSNNVILPRERWGFAADPELHALTRRSPGRWVRVYYGKPGSRHVGMTWRMHAKRAHFHRLHRHAERTEHGGEAEHRHRHHHDEAGRLEKEDGGIFMNIRKFLGQF